MENSELINSLYSRRVELLIMIKACEDAIIGFGGTVKNKHSLNFNFVDCNYKKKNLSFPLHPIIKDIEYPITGTNKDKIIYIINKLGMNRISINRISIFNYIKNVEGFYSKDKMNIKKSSINTTISIMKRNNELNETTSRR